MYYIHATLAAAEEDYTNQVTYYELNDSSGHCFNINLINDDIMELVEDFDLSVHVLSSLSPALVDPEKRTTSIIIVDDDGNNKCDKYNNNYFSNNLQAGGSLCSLPTTFIVSTYVHAWYVL